MTDDWVEGESSLFRLPNSQTFVQFESKSWDRGTQAMLKLLRVFMLGISLMIPTQELSSLSAIPNQPSAEAETRSEKIARAKALYFETMDYLDAGEYEKAEPLAAEVLRLNRELLGEEHPNTIASLSNYAFALEGQGRANEVEPLYAQALRQSREVLGERHPSTLISLDNYSRILSVLGRSIEAEPLINEAYLLSREVLGENHPQTIRSLANYAVALLGLGRVSEAEPLFAQALLLSRKVLGEQHSETLTILNNNAVALKELGRAREAEPLFAETLRLRGQILGERHPDTIQSLTNYASVLKDLGRARDAEPFYAQALRQSREVLGERHPLTIVSLSNYASVLNHLGRARDAEPIFAEALRLSREARGERHPATIQQLNSYAAVLADVGRVSEAKAFFVQALYQSREVLGERHPDTLVILGRYADFLHMQGRIDEAEPVYLEALRLRREVMGDKHPATLGTMSNYAIALERQGRASEARQFYTEALRLSREVLGDRHPDTLDVMGQHARHLLYIKQHSASVALFGELVEATRTRAIDLTDQGIGGITQLRREILDSQTVEKFYAEALWAESLDSHADVDALVLEAFHALQIGSAGSASRAVTEAAAAKYAVNRGLQDLVLERQTLVREWPTIEAELIRNQVGRDATERVRADLRARLGMIEARIRNIDEQFKREAPEYFTILSRQAFDIEEVRSILDEDEGILLLVPTDLGTHAMVVTDKETNWLRSDWNAADIAFKVDKLRGGLEVSSGGGLPLFDFDLAHEIYAELIAPVESELEDVSRIYVVADGPLSRLPLGVLLTRSHDATEIHTDSVDANTKPLRATVFGGSQVTAIQTNSPADLLRASWLADRYALVNLPSLQSLVYIRTFGLRDEVFDGSGYTGFGDPVLAGHASSNASRSAGLDAVDAATLLARGEAGDAMMNPASLRQLVSLPGTKQELEEVSQLLGASNASLFLGAAMTEPAIRKADLSKTRILHLATHGLTSEEGGRLGDLAEPGLVFTPPDESSEANDGYLAASEVVGLDLTFAEWVILSACNTAAPSGKAGETGLSGLAQSFFYAGAESLLVSHWPVFDSVAPLLTSETLSRAQNGTPRAEAFQQAMQEVRKAYPHPAAWAPFVLVGEGR